eukprot:TRINITY_DN30895_c0_g1_i1.p1 TRINITY_DN30895_c0_g1~~TRINITY_DN30895_c0_g1_i1.p1  ORF type:complete len:296 (-),score=64.98 TRINITY_DN30895_c0_g1_i1:148-1035(-)
MAAAVAARRLAGACLSRAPLVLLRPCAAEASCVSRRLLASLARGNIQAARQRQWLLSPVLGQVQRSFSSGGEKRDGSVKMWNEERGFGFIMPSNGGEDVFMHRSALGEGVVVQAGSSVTYIEEWDDRKRKYRATDVHLGGSGSSAAAAPASTSTPSAQSSTPAANEPPKAYHFVGSSGDWQIKKSPMVADDRSARYRLIVRVDAPQAKTNKTLRREEFQILGDGVWDKRFYPAGGDKEETVVLQAGEAPSQAASNKGKGHGRNWAVEGKPGNAFDIVYDIANKTVSVESVFSEGS